MSHFIESRLAHGPTSLLDFPCVGDFLIGMEDAHLEKARCSTLLNSLRISILKPSDLKPSETFIGTPSIGVTTQGPHQWFVTTKKFIEAQRSRKRFSRQGLSCSRIEDRGSHFKFTVDASATVEGASPSKPALKPPHFAGD